MAEKKPRGASASKYSARPKTEKKIPIFTREQLLRAKRFANRRDALGVIVELDEAITMKEAEDRLQKFMKRKVE